MYPTIELSPRERPQAAHELIHYATGQSTLGAVLVASSDTGIVAILIGDQVDDLFQDLEHRFPAAYFAHSAGSAPVAQVIDYIDHPSGAFELPLDMRGTDFQRQVWSALQTIPTGTTESYSELAATLGQPKGARAVAAACAANKLAVVVPCHRVVGKGGALSGYRWGLDRKRQLIDREAARRTA
jgi:AraC family transcriptional regulator of adaptative response/methylated-DNA-[protein]-cysteine methyltransferase